MRTALLASCLCALSSPLAAQVKLTGLSASAAPAARLAPALSASALQAGLSPAASLAAPRLASPLLSPSLAAPAVQETAVPQALLPLVDQKALSAALQPETPAAERSAALGKVFDGNAAPAAIPGLGAGAVEMINGAYGFYSWLARQPEAAAPEVQAGVLLAALPALEKGPVIVMKDAAAVTVLSANDASAPPIVAPFAAPVSPQAARLAARLEQAKAQDRAEGGIRMRMAELMANLASAAREAPEQPKAEAPSEPMPDPARQARPYMDRLLRDAMREADPFQALERLAFARGEARKRLSYQDASRFLEQLRGGAELLARQFVPGLLERVQQAAGRGDEAQVERVIKAALDFCEYAPAWKNKTIKAYEQARNTLELLDRYGPIDEKTGLPVPPAPSPEPS